MMSIASIAVTRPKLSSKMSFKLIQQPDQAIGQNMNILESRENLGLSDVDVNSCKVSDSWKLKLTGRVVKYQDISLEVHWTVGKQRTVHRIRLKDERPFRPLQQGPTISIPKP